MTSGNSFLRKLNDAESRLSEDARGRSAVLNDLRQRQTRLRSAVARGLLDIAKAQATALDRNQIDGYDHTTQDLDRQLDVRQRAGEMVEEQRNRALAQLEEKRSVENTLVGQVDQVTAEIKAITSAVAKDLEVAPEYVDLVGAAEAARTQAQTARRKSDLAETDRSTKLGAYTEDPLFAYLNKRKFGTESYQASAVTRTIDGWVARLCNYHQASRDFEALQMLPEFLGDRANAMEKAFEQAAVAVDDARRRSLVAAGVEPHEVKLEGLNKDLKQARQACEKLEQTAESAEEQLRRFSNWTDPAATKLLETMSEVMASESLAQLQARVLKTESQDDDRAFAEIRQAQASLAAIALEIVKAEQATQAVDRRLTALRDVKRQYKSKNYDSSNYSIRGSAPAQSLEGFLVGAVTGNDLWSAISRAADYDPPTSTYSSSSSSSSWGSSSRSSGGGFGGGGFSSGGSFGGGGFKTGGGF